MSTQVDDLLLLLVSMRENSWGCWGVNLKLKIAGDGCHLLRKSKVKMLELNLYRLYSRLDDANRMCSSQVKNSTICNLVSNAINLSASSLLIK